MEGMGYNRTMYPIDWKNVSRDLGRPELVENAQLRKIHFGVNLRPISNVLFWFTKSDEKGQICRRT